MDTSLFKGLRKLTRGSINAIAGAGTRMIAQESQQYGLFIVATSNGVAERGHYGLAISVELRDFDDDEIGRRVRNYLRRVYQQALDLKRIEGTDFHIEIIPFATEEQVRERLAR